jgi:hypothetical protein
VKFFDAAYRGMVESLRGAIRRWAVAGGAGRDRTPGSRMIPHPNRHKHLAEQAFFQHPSTSYKYVRPMAQRGVAAEIRCLDKQPTIAGTMVLLALCKAMVNRVSAGDLGSDSLLAMVHEGKAFQRARRHGGVSTVGTLRGLS